MIEQRQPDAGTSRAGAPLRVAIIAPVLPYDGIPHAGGVYLQHLHRALVESGARVTFLVHDVGENREAATKPRAPDDVHFLGYSRRHSWAERLIMWAAWNLEPHVVKWDPTWPPIPLMAQLLISPEARRALRRADVVDVQWPEYARLLPVVRALNPGARRITTLHDVLSQRWARRALPPAADHALVTRATRSARRLERSLDRRHNTVVVFSEKDRHLLPCARRASVEVVDPPLGGGFEAERHPERDPSTVVFVSLLSRAENDDAARWLVGEIWPRVLSGAPEARLRLIGGGASGDLAALCAGAERVELAGFVNDLAAQYAAASACVVPLRRGAGVKFKTIEALLAGVPTVTTSVGAEGIGGPERFAALSDDADELADALVAILHDPSGAEREANGTRLWAHERYSLSKFRHQVQRIYGLGNGQGSDAAHRG